MTERKITSRIVHKHDIAENWSKATNFCPKQGELIIYDDRYIDAEGNEVIVADCVRYKIGDGVRLINDLPFATDALQTKNDDALATSDKTIVGAINEINGKVIPTYDTTADEGKFFRIVNGAPAWVAIPSAEEAEF